LATIGKILKDNGYWTSWFGKDHNTPDFQASQAGPFDQWPTGMGFDCFYGFVGGDANQWQPNLFRNTTAIYPYYNNPSWNLITGMADDAIEYLRRHHGDQPGSTVLRARSCPRAASPDARVDQEDQRHALVRRWLEQAARYDLCEPETTRCNPAGRQAHAMAS
jgi:Sulfatase